MSINAQRFSIGCQLVTTEIKSLPERASFFRRRKWVTLHTLPKRHAESVIAFEKICVGVGEFLTAEIRHVWTRKFLLRCLRQASRENDSFAVGFTNI